MPLQFRRGLQQDKENMTVPLAVGEPLYVTDTQQLFIGDGLTLEAVLVSGYSDQESQNATARLLLGADPTGAPDNTRHSNITFQYDDDSNRIDATVNFSGIAVLEADAFKGSLFADDSTLLVDAVDSKIVGTIDTLIGNITNLTSVNFDVQNISTANQFGVNIGAGGNNNLVVLQNSVLVQNVPLTVDAGVIANTTGYHTGDVSGSVFGSDSTLLVDAVDGVLRGNLIGNLTGSVEGDIATGSILVNTSLAEGGPTAEDRGILIITEGSLSDDYNLFTIQSYHADDESPAGMAFTRGRGTLTDPLPANSNDPLFAFIFSAVGTDLTTHLSSSIETKLDGALLGSGTIAPGKIEISTTDAGGDLTVGLSIDSNQLIGFSNSNVVIANDGPGTADVTSGVVTYLKIKVGNTEYAMPLYDIIAP
jgi:hypothetical protein